MNENILCVINMSKTTFEKQQNNRPLKIKHLPRAHRYKFKWKGLSFPSYSLLIPTCQETLHCLLLAAVLPEGNSTKIPGSASAYNGSHSSSGFQGDPSWLVTVEHSWVLSGKSFITSQTKISGKKSQWEGNFTMLFKIFQPSCFGNLPSLSPGRHWFLGRDFFHSEKTCSSELSLL